MHTKTLHRKKQLRYLQIAERFQRQILDGALCVGERLPSLRELKTELCVSHGTALNAYMALERMGYIECRPQSGFYVQSGPWQLHKRLKRAACPTRPVPADPLLRLINLHHDAKLQPFGFAAPSLDLLPAKDLSAILKELAAHPASALLEYATPPGLWDLRSEIAKRASYTDLPLSPEDIVITAGGMDAINLALRAVTKPGDLVATESPTHMNILAAIANLNLKYVELPTDPVRGIIPQGVRAALKKYKLAAVVLMPQHHNPLGCSVPPEVKAEIVATLAKAGVPLIEDNVYGELFFGDRSEPPMKAYDSGGHVLYCGSFSKTLAPGLRVGWIAPGLYAERVERLQFSAAVGSSVLSQRVVAEFLKSGKYARHLRSLRSALREQCRDLRQGILRLFPDGTTVSAPDGGFVVWVTLPPAVSGLQLFELAAARGVGVIPGALFSPTASFDRCIRMSCGSPADKSIELALKLLGEQAHYLASAAQADKRKRKAAVKDRLYQSSRRFQVTDEE